MWGPILSKVRNLFFLAGDQGQLGAGSVLGVVYVAYLDEDWWLLSAYPIRLWPGEDVVAVVVADEMAQAQRCRTLVGLPAELLFVSITGRGLDTDPEDADPLLAYQARVCLATGAGKLSGFAEAYAAVAAFGSHIKPWYGMWRLREGRVVLGDPCYRETLDIPMLVGVGV